MRKSLKQIQFKAATLKKKLQGRKVVEGFGQDQQAELEEFIGNIYDCPGKKARQLAGDHVFSEHDAEYSVQSVTPINHFFFEGRVRVCAHEVSFIYRGIPRPLNFEEQNDLRREAEERAKSQIIEDYIQGELNYESETLSCQGWWQIEKE
jgi:hypothetical protein